MWAGELEPWKAYGVISVSMADVLKPRKNWYFSWNEGRKKLMPQFKGSQAEGIISYEQECKTFLFSLQLIGWGPPILG